MRESTRTCAGTRFVAFLLIFCMVLQMFSIRPKEVRAEEESTKAVTEVQNKSTDNLTLNDRIVSEPIQGGETKVEDDGNLPKVTPDQAPIKEREVSDITDNTDLLTLGLGSLHQMAKGTETIPFENKDNVFDLTKADMQKSLFFKWNFALNKGILSGDTIRISLPKTAGEAGKDYFIFKDTQNAVAVKTPEGIELGSYVIKDNEAIFTLNEAAAKVEDEPITFDVALEGVINQETLKDGESTDVIVMPQGKIEDNTSNLTLKLPSKAATPIPEQSPEPTPSPAPEVKQEESKTLQNLKGFFGVQTINQAGMINDTSVDVTEEVNEIGINFNRLSYTDKNNITYKIKKTGTNFDISNINYADIKGLILGLDFNIICNDQKRTIKQGDTFHYYIPEGMVPENENELPKDAPLTFQGVEIAEYSIAKDPAQKQQYKLTVVFTDHVNIEEGYVNIKGGFDINLKFDPEKLGGKDPKEISLQVQSKGERTTLNAPPTITKVDGITKKGTYNPDNRSITWEIEIGTESKGAPLAGLEIKDTFNGNELEYRQGTAFIGSEAINCEGSGGNYTCKISVDSKLTAPQTLKLITTVKDDALTRISSGDVSIKNDAEMSAPQNANIIVGDKAKANDTVTIPKTGLQKHGTVLNSDTIKWTIDINNTEVKNTMWNAVLTDKMGKGLQFKKDKLYMTIDGGVRQQITVVDKGAVEPLDVNYAVYDSASNSFDLYFKNPNPVKSACTLEYETSIDPQKYPDNENHNNPDLQNTVSIKADWPNAEGDGPGIVPFEGKIGLGIDFNAADIKKTGNANNQTGEIEWTINPSTRRNSFDNAVITDTIPNDQDFISSSMVIKNGNDIINSPDVLKQNGNILTFTFDHSKYKSINDIKITYKTKALNFFTTNNENHIYKNEAKLVVNEKGTQFNSQATPSVTFKNDFLEKVTEYQVPSGTEQGYMHYTIKLNQNKLNLTDLHFSDDLSKIITNVLDIDGKKTGDTLENAWVIERSKTQVKVNDVVDDSLSLDYSNNDATPIVSKNFGNTSSSYEINLYLKLSDSAKNELGKKDCTLQTQNSVLAGANELNNNADFSVTSTGEQPNGQVANKLANKTNITAENIHNKFDWMVMINPNGATLADSTDVNHVSIEDTLPKGLEFDLSSVRLKDATGHPVANDQFEVKVTGNSTDTVMSVILKLSLCNKPLTLEYTTVVVGQLDDPNGNFSNHAKLIVDSKTISESSESASVENGAWAYLEKMASFQYTKYDEESGITKPLPGATFALYKDSIKIKEVTSDENGEFTFWGLDVSATNERYTFEEIKAPEGYTVDPTRQIVPTDGKMGLHKGLSVIDKRTTSKETLEFTKNYNNSTYTPDTSYKFQSQFKLWLYPMGSGAKVQVCVTGSEGVYTYSHTGTPKDGSTEIDILKDLSNKIKISSLPWGTYAIEETQAAQGYSATKDLQKFEVAQNGDKIMWTSPSNGTLENKETTLAIEKHGDDGLFIEGATLAICKDKEGKNIVTPPLTNQKAKWKTGADKHTIMGLPAGDYWLVEQIAPPANPQVAKADPIPFNVDNYGVVKVNGKESTDKTITMTDKTNKITVKKLDQFGKPVKGLLVDTLQLKENDENGDVVSAETTTDPDKYVKVSLDKDKGVYTFSGLHRDTVYYLEEPTTVINYLIARPITFKVDEYGKILNDDTLNLNNEKPDNTEPDAFKNQRNSDSTLTLRDERIVGQMSLTKKDGNTLGNAVLSGVGFDLYKDGDNTTPINKGGYLYSDVNGIVSTKDAPSKITNRLTNEPLSNGLGEGTYYFVEKETHGDYVLPKDDAAKSGTVAVTEDNRYTWKEITPNPKEYINSVGEMTNTPLKNNITIQKNDIDDKGVIGAEYGLYYADGTNKDKIVTGGPDGKQERRVTTGKKDDVRTWTDSNNNKYEYQLSKDGEACFYDVKQGKFYIKETKPAPGYTLDSTPSEPITIENKPDEDHQPKAFTNKQTALQLNKTDDQKNELANSEFTITPAKPKTFADGSTTGKTLKPLDKTANTLTGQLIAGDTYTVSETKVPGGYTKADDFTIKVEMNGNITVNGSRSDITADNLEDCKLLTIKDTATSFSFNKIDQFKNNVAGAQLKITGTFAKAKDSIIWNTSDSDANPKTITGELIAGEDYTLSENDTPSGYQPIPEVDFKVSADGKSISINKPLNDNRVQVAGSTLKLTDRKIMGHVQLKKVDSTDKSKTLDGVKFKLFKESIDKNKDVEIAELTTGNGGIITTVGQSSVDNKETGQKLSAGLSVGKYYFVETSTLSNYVMDTAHIKFEVEVEQDYYDSKGAPQPNKLIAKEKENTPFTATIHLNKQDATNKAGIAEVAFTLLKGTSIIDTLKTDADGNLTFTITEKGSYTLQEAIVPTGYTEASKFEATFNLTDDCQGKTFEINADQKDPAFNLKTTKGDWNSTGITNTRKPASFILEKIDAVDQSKKLDGAVFEIRDKDGKTVFTATTGKTYDFNKPKESVDAKDTGTLTINNLPWGNYKVVETTPPAGYKLPVDNTVKDLIVGANALEVKWSDTSAVGNNQNSLTINKTGIENAPLIGAKLTVTDKEGTIITLADNASSWTQTGVFVAGEIYSLNEEGVPQGYETAVKTDDSKNYLAQFTLDNNGTVSITDNNMADGMVTVGDDSKSITLKNQPIEVTVNKAKDLDEKEPLENAAFKITGKFADGTTKEKEIKNNDDTVLHGMLIPGEKYTITETKRPDGYKNLPQNLEFHVNTSGEVIFENPEAVKAFAAIKANGTAFNIVLKDDLVNVGFIKTDSEGKAIAGAELKIEGKFANETATIKTIQSDTSGAIKVLGLIAEESYTLSETSPAWGYKLSYKKVTFKVNLDGTITLTDPAGVASLDATKENIAFKNEAITASLSKTDQKGLPISNVIFEMEGNFAEAPETSVVKTFMTDDKGSINLDKQILAGQTYTLTETSAPMQYQINPSPIQITVGNDEKLTIKDPTEEVQRIASLSKDGTKLIVKNDLKLGNIAFSKKAIEDEGVTETTVRQGITFGIYTDSECIVPVSRDNKSLTATSVEDGTVTFSNLPAGMYYIKEAPQVGDVSSYYKANKNIYTANIDGSIADNTGGIYGIEGGDSKDNTVVNTAIRGEISLKKVNDEFKTIDAQGKEVTLKLPLSGAVFAVCPKDDPQSIVAAILEKDGAPGEYGLMPAQNINWESGYKVVERNVFGISYLLNNRLLAGEYTIVETTAPAGYTKPENPVGEIHIAEGKTIHNSIITNITKKADIPVEKQIEVKTNNQKTEMKAAGEGFSFSLERIAEPNGDALRFHYTAKAKTGQDGKAVFGQVPIGQYKVTEMAVGGLTEPYVMPEPKTVTVKEDGTVSCDNTDKVSFDNYLTQITFNKAGCISEHCSDTPDLSKPLADAVFGIYADPSCTEKVLEATSDADGNVRFTGVNHGLWYIKEISAPRSYVVNPSVYIAELDEKGHFEGLTKIDGQKVEDNSILNEAVRGSIKLIKRDEQTGALLPNSTYGLYKKVTKQSRMQGAIQSRNIDSEFEAVEGYELITTSITDGVGEILFDGLLTGPEYLVKELKAPDGSKVSANPIMLSFKLDATGQGAIIGKADNGNGTAEINPDGTVTWKEPPVMVDIYKQDMKGKNLAGATLRITDKDGKSVEGVDDWVSTGEPHVIMGKLNGGQEYILTEVAAPSGYVLAEPVHFTVSDEPVGPGESYHEPIYMKDDTTKVQFSKTDITNGSELPGAKLSLKDSMGNMVEEWTSSDKPHLIEGKLTAGASYTLTEITAPQGYAVAESISFTVGTDGKLQTVTMMDKPIVKPDDPVNPNDPAKEITKPIPKGPGTGLFGTDAQSSIWTMMALLALAALIVCGTVVYRRKH